MKTAREKSLRQNLRSYEDARDFVRTLGLKSKDEWIIWAKSRERPVDIPASPSHYYKLEGWVSWGDWLGTKNRKGGYRSFKDARAFVRALKLKNQYEWLDWAISDARPSDIPSNPRDVYKEQGWIGMWDWLGTKNRRGHFRSFEEARAYVHSLNLKNSVEWKDWAKSDIRPDDIPISPRSFYKNKGWISMGDWLGTDRIASFKMVYRSFEEARIFAQSLGFKKQHDWRKWAQSNNRPHDIPKYPDAVYKNKGWVSWGDWLGSGAKRGEHPTFQEARAFVRDLHLQNQTEWRQSGKEIAKQYGIPTTPDRTYKTQGWVSWSDWLGTRNARNIKTGYRSFDDAKAFAQNLGLKSWEEWKIWASSENRPTDIPANPDSVYKNHGWSGMGDWLGTGRIANQNIIYQSFEKARGFVRSLKLKSFDEWKAWARSEARPSDIPIYPSAVYRNDGWSSWGDWLGTRIRKRGYLPYDDAKAIVRGLDIKTKDEWIEWSKTENRPADIPANPAGVYRNKGWRGWGEWLGIVNLWNKNAILSFLNAIKPILHDLQPVELYAIMRQNGLIAAIRHKNNNNILLIKDIKDIGSSATSEVDIENLVIEIEKQNSTLDSELPDGNEREIEVSPSEHEVIDELPELRSLTSLKAVDALVEAGITSDEETIEFLVANRVSGLWQDVLNKDLRTELENLRGDTGGIYFNTIRQRFLSQYDGAQSLMIPAGYSFMVEGKLAPPNLMQRLTAYRVLTEKRLGNWSGVGAGKTLSAILASRVTDARLTVVVAFNSTIQPWAIRIKEAFPDSIIHIKERGDVYVDLTKHTYLILNFETFQQPGSVSMVQSLIEKHKIDFVVLDEIQSVKQRTPKISSKRRQVVSGLLSTASEKNPNLCVLGMSATPVINNLYEGKALLELVKGVEFNDLNTFSSIANASALHEKLILHGIRYRPEYKQTVETEYIEISGKVHLPRLQKIRKGTILDLETVLLDAKLETIIASLRKGTLIYTHYLTGLVTPLRHAIEKAGFKVGLFTGEDKSGLDLFKKGKVDVLIGSVPVGTGVDGLQYICNRMIVVSLPWTSAEYEQLIGRLYRQGSAFDKVEIIIPQVVLDNDGDVWSWDKMRMHRIQYKKTLADAALDGVIPLGELAAPEKMFKQAREALQAWITRIESEGITFIERSKLRVPLPKETAQIIQRHFGDLSVMNSRINSAYSSTTHGRLNDNPEEWYLYHTLYREARKTWPVIPYEKIAKSLKKRPDWVIGDFGCGEAKLAEILPNKVYSFDHIAVNEKVTACDMTRTPLEEETLDVAVFSLSLMGLNYVDYLKEAYRTLKFGGVLKIAEPVTRWQDKKEELLSNIAKTGFLLIGEAVVSNQFFYIDGIKTETT